MKYQLFILESYKENVKPLNHVSPERKHDRCRVKGEKEKVKTFYSTFAKRIDTAFEEQLSNYLTSYR